MVLHGRLGQVVWVRYAGTARLAGHARCGPVWRSKDRMVRMGWVGPAGWGLSQLRRGPSGAVSPGAPRSGDVSPGMGSVARPVGHVTAGSAGEGTVRHGLYQPGVAWLARLGLGPSRGATAWRCGGRKPRSGQAWLARLGRSVRSRLRSAMVGCGSAATVRSGTASFGVDGVAGPVWLAAVGECRLRAVGRGTGRLGLAGVVRLAWSAGWGLARFAVVRRGLCGQGEAAWVWSAGIGYAGRLG